jgi:hypothetical protein
MGIASLHPSYALSETKPALRRRLPRTGFMI